MVNQALSTWVAQTAKVLPHPSLHSKIVDGGEHNKKLRILSGQTKGEKITEVLQGKDTGTSEEISNTAVKLKGTRHSPELNAGCVWKWKEKPSCFSQDRIIFNDHYIMSATKTTNLCFSVILAKIHQ